MTAPNEHIRVGVIETSMEPATGGHRPAKRSEASPAPSLLNRRKQPVNRLKLV
jgi:hypothetical protein